MRALYEFEDFIEPHRPRQGMHSCDYRSRVSPKLKEQGVYKGKTHKSVTSG